MPPPVLLDELIEEVLLRLPPDDPTFLVRASAVCKPWRRTLASPRFRRRYRQFHRTPPLLGFFKGDASFVSTSSPLPSQPALPGWTALDCRHGRALFAPDNPYAAPFYLIVLDPMTLHQSRVLPPYKINSFAYFSAAVLCAVQGCDHLGCQAGHFRVAFLSMDVIGGVTSAWLYSSETGAWSEPASLHDPNAITYCRRAAPSVLLGDALYFNIDGIINYQLSTLRLSTFEKPITYKGPDICDGCLMVVEDGGLGFAAVVEFTNLTMWSMETGPEGQGVLWVKLREINLKTLLSDGAFLIPEYMYGHSSWPLVFLSGFAEGAQVIFVSTFVGCYMVDLKSGRACRKVSYYCGTVFPYMSFYIPAMEAASLGQEQ